MSDQLIQRVLLWVLGGGRRRWADADMLPRKKLRDLKSKLRRGFAGCAVDDLKLEIRAAEWDVDRLHAAWTLARYFAQAEDWSEVLQALQEIDRCEPAAFLDRGKHLLHLQARLALGQRQPIVASWLVGLPLGSYDANLRAAASNLIGVEPTRGRFRASEARRLKHLNRIFKACGLATVRRQAATPILDFSRFESIAVPQLKGETISVLVSSESDDEALIRTVRLVLRQTWCSLEVIVVQATGASSVSRQIEALAELDSRLVVLCVPAATTHVESLNAAAQKATGAYLAVIDAGCTWLHPQLLQNLHAELVMESAPKFVMPNCAYVNDDFQYSLDCLDETVRYFFADVNTFLVRRRDFGELQRWDEVAEFAHHELRQRAQLHFGSDMFRGSRCPAPMVFYQVGSQVSRERHAELPVASAGWEYLKQAAHWVESRHSAGSAGMPERQSALVPFPVPAAISSGNRATSSAYDLIIISDLSLLGGTRRCNEAYIEAAQALGLRVGLYHWPRYDLRLKTDIAKAYRNASVAGHVDILTTMDKPRTRLLLIHHPPILKYRPDSVARIDADQLIIVANQLPFAPGETADFYYDEQGAQEACRQAFGLTPVWVPISPLVSRVLKQRNYGAVSDQIWYPPLSQSFRFGAERVSANRKCAVVGRHSRDHWTKWPDSADAIRAAYCANRPWKVRFLGGTSVPKEMLKDWPTNWESHDFDSMAVRSFLEALDVFVHFTHSSYTEEFGRNVLEAMACGVPTVLDPRQSEIFGEAACYATHGEVVRTIEHLCSDYGARADLIDRGLQFAMTSSGALAVQQRLLDALSGEI